ncbi:hypothetical protein EO244_08790 [Ancylomarina salipaludis]|uniref:NRDE family protein n=1 Tax=Ancylomarina salipaludis TaxID=2501299 RepID=A0A4Q1JM66_9BACT|nr:NRDE family protein [Ancylomarina salipaludis]RXQ94369.1 hypothetical protein EO244_08790 [Ancylomarina salipaludis]
MCTLSYIPIVGRDFIITVNRDEDPSRLALRPQKYIYNGFELFYPKDSKANGSWIISNCKDTCLCVLNGAFKKHKRKANYRQSRGLMLLDFFGYANLDDFIKNYPFDGIEAFTLIVVENKTGIRLTELVWDEQKLFIKEFDSSKSHIWSSTSLYTDAMKLERKKWFQDWLNNASQLNADSILEFHKTGGSGNKEYGLLMNRRNFVRTVCITQILGFGSEYKMRYIELTEDDLNKTD